MGIVNEVGEAVRLVVGVVLATRTEVRPHVVYARYYVRRISCAGRLYAVVHPPHFIVTVAFRRVAVLPEKHDARAKRLVLCPHIDIFMRAKVGEVEGVAAADLLATRLRELEDFGDGVYVNGFLDCVYHCYTVVVDEGVKRYRLPLMVI